MDAALLIFFIIILVVGVIVFFMVATRSKGSSRLNVEKFRTDWLRIEQSVIRDNESSYQLAILNADKLLDRALKQRGFKGETMGERMKTANATWKNANAVWSAHKLRNHIAHETSVRISYEQLRDGLAGFKQALKDIGAI